MKFKVVPDPPDDLGRVRAVQRAVPLVPGTVEDCCARVVAETPVAARDDAREWLTFLRALGLVAETDRGYRRTRADPDPATLAPAFRERVFAAGDVLDAVAADGPLTADRAFAAVRDRVPEWERSRHTDWEREWRERVRRLLDWAVLFGLVERADGTYRAVEGSPADDEDRRESEAGSG